MQSFNGAFKNNCVKSFETIENLTKTDALQLKCDEVSALSNNFTAEFNRFKNDIEVSFKNEENLSSEFEKNTLDKLENLKFQMDSFQKTFQQSSQMMFDQFQIIQNVVAETINQRQKNEKIYLDLDSKLKTEVKNFQISLESQKTDIQDIIKLKGLCLSFSFLLSQSYFFFTSFYLFFPFFLFCLVFGFFPGFFFSFFSLFLFCLDSNHSDVSAELKSLKDFQRNFLEQFNEKIVSLENKMCENHTETQQTLKHATMKCEVLGGDLRKQTTTSIEILNNLDKDDDCHTQKIIDMGTELEQTLKTQHKNITSEMDVYRELNQKSVNHIESELESHVKTSLGQVRQERAALLNGFTNVFNEFGNMNLNTVNGLKDSAQSMQGDLKEAITKEKDMLNSFLSSQSEHLLHCDNISKEFHSSKLPNYSYKETGATPRRIDYVYPKKFTITSPHSRIIERAVSENKISKIKFEDIEEKIEDCPAMIEIPENDDGDSHDENENVQQFNESEENLQKTYIVSNMSEKKVKKILGESN